MEENYTLFRTHLVGNKGRRKKKEEDPFCITTNCRLRVLASWDKQSRATYAVCGVVEVAQFDLAGIVDAGGVGEFVSGERHARLLTVASVLELAHYLAV